MGTPSRVNGGLQDTFTSLVLITSTLNSVEGFSKPVYNYNLTVVISFNSSLSYIATQYSYNLSYNYRAINIQGMPTQHYCTIIIQAVKPLTNNSHLKDTFARLQTVTIITYIYFYSFSPPPPK